MRIAHHHLTSIFMREAKPQDGSSVRRLQIYARCPANGAASATSVDDATSPRLNDTAERDYFTLRERIETVKNQLTGLQAYVRQQCLK